MTVEAIKKKINGIVNALITQKKKNNKKIVTFFKSLIQFSDNSCNSEAINNVINTLITQNLKKHLK